MDRSILVTDDRLNEPRPAPRRQEAPAARIPTATTMSPHAPASIGPRDPDRVASAATVEVPRLRPRDPVAQAVLVALETALSRIRGTEADARRGAVEGIHRLRTTTRRLRSELSGFRDLVDRDWIGPLEGELKWLGTLLGDVRDLDVLTARFRKAGAEDGSPDESLAPLFADLMARHTAASRALRSALQGERYRELIAGVERAAARPSFGGEGCTPCRKALPPVACEAWRRLKKRARALRPGDPDDDFHEVRKRSKRARYTAELVSPILSGVAGRGARRFIRGATRVQDVLGEHQDAIVAGDEVARVLERHPDDPSFGRAGHRLLEGQAKAASDSREAFFDVWDKFDRKKSRRWLSSTG